jgi:DNA-binding CsgD family transcriptional regulator
MVAAMTYKQQQAIWRKRRAKLQRLLAEGLKPAEVARQMGISRQRIHTLMAKDV